MLVVNIIKILYLEFKLYSPPLPEWRERKEDGMKDMSKGKSVNFYRRSSVMFVCINVLRHLFLNNVEGRPHIF